MAAPAPGLPGVTAKMLIDINFWRRYHGHDPSTDYDALAVARFYRTRPYIAPAPPSEGTPNPTVFLHPPRPPSPPVAYPAEQLRRDFLNQTLPDIPHGAASWRPRRFLGQGASALAGMWEWAAAPAVEPPLYTKLVLKEHLAAKVSNVIHTEWYFLATLATASSAHIVRSLQAIEEIKLGVDVGLGPEWNGGYRRLYLEFCELGSLQDLLDKRIAEQKPFSELTLWLILNCLVDGVCAMEYGAELTFDPATGQAFSRFVHNWNKIIHFDVKPDNILLSGADIDHQITPVLKFADFGLAQFWEPNVAQPERAEELRRHGTEDFHPPEQFTEEWEGSDYLTSTVAGQYSYATNLWGVGCLMFQLIMLSDNPPSHRNPFLPSFTLNGSPPKGPTYGNDILAYSFSKTLTDVIFELLYETPSFRPDLLQLKVRIRIGYQAAFTVDRMPEPYDDFLPPDPIGPVPNPPVVPATPVPPVIIAANALAALNLPPANPTPRP